MQFSNKTTNSPAGLRLFQPGEVAIDGWATWRVFRGETFFFLKCSFLAGEPWSKNCNIDASRQAEEASRPQNCSVINQLRLDHVGVFFPPFIILAEKVTLLNHGLRACGWTVPASSCGSSGELLGPRLQAGDPSPSQESPHRHIRRGFILHIGSSREAVCQESGENVHFRWLGELSLFGHQPHPQGTFKGQDQACSEGRDWFLYKQNSIILKTWNVINYLCVPFLHIKHTECWNIMGTIGVFRWE